MSKLHRFIWVLMITICLISYQTLHAYELTRENDQRKTANKMECINLPFPLITMEENQSNPYIADKTAVGILDDKISVLPKLDDTKETERWNIDMIGAKKAWLEGFTGKGVNIAIIDTGITKHPDLEIAGGVSTVDYTEAWSDDNGHGTHIAGVIGAKQDNRGVVGVAPDANLYSVKALDKNGEGQLEDVIEAIQWSIENDMDIINLSVGTGSRSPLLMETINQAYAAGILIVAASGNDSEADSVVYPAKFEHVIAVSAVDGRLNLTPFASYGPEVEFAAPGFRIVSTYINGAYGVADGTSQAAAHVTGMLALLKGKFPDAANQELQEALVHNSQDIGDAGRDTSFGHGFISYDAMDEDAPAEVGKLEIIEKTSSAITIGWEKPEDMDFEKIDLYMNDSFIASIPQDEAATFTFEELGADTTYIVTLYTVDAVGNQSEGNTILGRTKQDDLVEALPKSDEEEIPDFEVSGQADKECVTLDSVKSNNHVNVMEGGFVSEAEELLVREDIKERNTTDMGAARKDIEQVEVTTSENEPNRETEEADNIFARIYQSSVGHIKSMIGWLLD